MALRNFLVICAVAMVGVFGKAQSIVEDAKMCIATVAKDRPSFSVGFDNAVEEKLSPSQTITFQKYLKLQDVMMEMRSKLDVCLAKQNVDEVSKKAWLELPENKFTEGKEIVGAGFLKNILDPSEFGDVSEARIYITQDQKRMIKTYNSDCPPHIALQLRSCGKRQASIKKSLAVSMAYTRTLEARRRSYIANTEDLYSRTVCKKEYLAYKSALEDAKNTQSVEKALGDLGFSEKAAAWFTTEDIQDLLGGKIKLIRTEFTTSQENRGLMKMVSLSRNVTSREIYVYRPDDQSISRSISEASYKPIPCESYLAKNKLYTSGNAGSR